MKRFTTVTSNGTTIKLTRAETEIEAIINAWEEKMQGKTVKVVNDETTETIYR